MLLVGVLCAVVLAFIVSRHDLTIPSKGKPWTFLDDPFITREAVLSYLDGKAIPQLNSTDAAGKPEKWLILKKEQIEALEMKSDDPAAMSVRFAVNSESGRHIVEASFVVFHSDSPSLHQHSFQFFAGSIVSDQ